MGGTAPVPNVPAPPGMCPGNIVLAGNGDGGGGGGDDGKDGKNEKGGNGKDGKNDPKGDGKGAPGDKDKGGATGDPIDVVTGRCITVPVCDLFLPGPLPVLLWRQYSSDAIKRDFGLGVGWAHAFSWRVEPKGAKRVVVWTEEGVAAEFDLPEVGQSILGKWGWILRREKWGFALDVDDGKWRIFSHEIKGGAAWLLTAVDDRNRNRIELKYTEDRLVEIVDSVGRRIRVDLDANGRIAGFAVRNAPTGGRWVYFARYEYTPGGDLAKATDADGQSWRYTYDTNHRMTSHTDRCGLTFHFVYDGKGRCIETWGDYVGRKDESLADSLPKVLADGTTRVKGLFHSRVDYMPDLYAEVARVKEIRRYFGNEHGTVDKVVMSGTVETCTYDKHGHLKSYANELGHVWTFERDVRGRVKKVVDPLGHETTYGIDSLGLIVSVKNAIGATWTTTRDARGNAALIERPNKGVIQIRYDGRGLPIESVNPTGARTTIDRDEHGNPVQVNLPGDGVIKRTFDFFGRVLTETTPDGERRFAYSDRGDLLSIHDVKGGLTRFSWDGERRLVEIADPDGRTSSSRYAGYGRLVAARDASGVEVRLRYDHDGNLVEVHNGKGEVYRFEYNAMNLCTKQTTFDGRVYAFEWDVIGRLAAMVDSLGRRTALAYDAVGNLVERTLHDGSTEAFQYDAVGRIVAVDGGETEGKVRFERDLLGMITRESHELDGDVASIDLEYDLGVRRTAMRTSTGHDQKWARDAAGFVQRTILPGDDVVHGYDARGREIARAFGDGGRIESAYDARGLLRGRRGIAPKHVTTLVGEGEPEWLGQKATGTTFRRELAYDGDGNVVSIAGGPEGVRRYRYDAAGRILEALDDRANRGRFSYDKGGSRLVDGEARVYGPGQRLLRRGDTTWRWDAEGQLAEKRRPNARGGEDVWRYEWTSKGQLAAVTLPDDRRIEFRYDAFWRRVEKRALDADGNELAKTRFVWEGGRMIHEIKKRAAAAGDPIVEERTYCYDDRRYTPMAHREIVREGARRTTSPWYHYVNDQVGMPQALLGPDGEVVCELETTEWGEAKPRAGSKVTTPIRFPGQFADEETGLSYNRFRYYDPEAGLFISADPSGIRGGLSAFDYTVNPQRYFDLYGLEPTDNMDKGEALEDLRKQQLADDGWKFIDTKVGSGNGIDICAYKTDDQGNISAVRIEENKANSSQLGDTVNNGQQMSDKWINANLDKANDGKARCEDTKNPKTTGDIKAFMNDPKNKDNVEVAVVKGKVSQGEDGKWNVDPTSLKESNVNFTPNSSNTVTDKGPWSPMP